MSFLGKAKSSKGEPIQIAYKERDDAIAAANWQERHGSVFQAVRIRLWNCLPQRTAHRAMVMKWCNSKLAEFSEPPAVPAWIGELPPDDSEDAQLDRAMDRLRSGQVTPRQVEAWPKRWREIGITQGYLKADGTLRFTE